MVINASEQVRSGWMPRLIQWLRHGGPLAAIVPRGRPDAPPAVDSELVTIRTYARFIAANPDMPAEHRRRFLSGIVRSCEEIGEAFT